MAGSRLTRLHRPEEVTKMEASGAVAQAEPRELSEADRAEEERREAALEAFSRDHEALTDEDEQDALDALLAPKPPRLYGVPVQFDTERGLKKLTFVIRGTDGRKIDAIEQQNVSDTTGKIDRLTADCQIVAEACVQLEGLSGRTVKLSDEEFLTIRRPHPDREGEMAEHRLASPADALEARFKTQLGLISGVAREVRRISGYDPERVGAANRRLVTAAGNS
jgi:hypothetical protein